jgi:hypothetical protein
MRRRCRKRFRQRSKLSSVYRPLFKAELIALIDLKAEFAAALIALKAELTELTTQLRAFAAALTAELIALTTQLTAFTT